MVSLTWHACKYKVHKLHQWYILQVTVTEQVTVMEWVIVTEQVIVTQQVIL